MRRCGGGEGSVLKNLRAVQRPMGYDEDCFLVPGPVRMGQPCLDAMGTPVMTARGAEFRDEMAKLNSGLRYAFNLSPSSPVRKSQSWEGEDGYKVIVV